MLIADVGRPLPVALQRLLVAVFLVVPAAMGVWVYGISPHLSDFALYYRDARVGWDYGWPHMYDLGGFDTVTRQLGITNHDPNVPSLSFPLLTWMVAPYALLPLSIGYYAWLVTLIGGVCLALLVATPPSPFAKGRHVLLAILFVPLVFGLTLGSAVIVIFVAIAVAWWLLQRGHSVAAGLVLCLFLVRPQVCLLIPICLLIAGRRRAVAAFLGGTSLIAAVVLVVVPQPELQAYVSRLVSAAQHPGVWAVRSEISLANLRPAPIAIGLMTLAALAAGAVSFLARNNENRDAIALTAGILGSLLVAPYIHAQDTALLLLVVWFLLRYLPASLWPAIVLPIAFASGLEVSIHTLLPRMVIVGWLVLLLGISLRNARAAERSNAAAPDVRCATG